MRNQLPFLELGSGIAKVIAFSFSLSMPLNKRVLILVRIESNDGGPLGGFRCNFLDQINHDRGHSEVAKWHNFHFKHCPYRASKVL
jgi:hypothetical protein